MGLTYKDSGVNIEAGNNFVKRITPFVKKTYTERVITGIGGFGALYSGAFPNMKDPVLVSGTDGVGTKLKIAQLMNIHDTIGIDAVAMCVNDIVVSGAMPLFFLDYISCGKLNEDVMVDIVKGIAHGCTLAGCSLIGGETAEHPNVMEDNDYDIAGFSVGVADREKIINGNNIKKGDVIIGLPSSGIHSNGYSFVRKLLFDIKGYKTETKINELEKSLGETLLTPTRIYTKSIISSIESGIILKGLVHITGGGFYENIPRILPDNIGVIIEKNSFTIHPIFNFMQKEGNVEDREMFTTFNMGIGMMVFADKNSADSLIKNLTDSGEKPLIIGEAVNCGTDRVVLK
jgi:phosphoribosylformylglycinamidine cyclo-ligase